MKDYLNDLWRFEAAQNKWYLIYEDNNNIGKYGNGFPGARRDFSLSTLLNDSILLFRVYGIGGRSNMVF